MERLKTYICEEDQKKIKKLRRKKGGCRSGQEGEERCYQGTNAEIKEKQQVRKF